MEIGKISGAQILVLGEVKKEDNGFTVSARIIKTETGIVIAGKKVTSKSLANAADKLGKYFSEILSIYVLLDNPDSPFFIKLKLNKGKNPVYKPDEKVKLKFIVNSKDKTIKKCFIKIYNITADGNIIRIFPNKFSDQKEIRTGKEYVFPEDNDDFDWIIEGLDGTESIQAIAVRENINLFSSGNDEVFPEVGRESEKKMRAIRVKMKKKKLGDYSAERITYRIEK